MVRPTYIWLAALAAIAVIASAMGYVSVQAVRLDRSEAEARAIAEREGRIRTALWRMDYALAPLVTQENLRPYTDYNAFYPAWQGFNRGQTQFEENGGLVPSPLLTADSPLVELYFQVGSDGTVTSPQAPAEGQLKQALNEFRTSEQLAKAQKLLDELRPILQRQALLAELPAATTTPSPVEGITVSGGVMQFSSNITGAGGLAQADQQAIPSQQLGLNQPVQTEISQAGQPAPVQQAVRQQMAANVNEMQARNTSFQTNAAMNNFDNGRQTLTLPQGKTARTTPQTLYVHEGVVKPLWIVGKLVLARRVELNRQSLVQGCWLNWPAVEAMLLGRVRDLLPQAQVRPVSNGTTLNPTNLLAGFPIELIPGEIQIELAPGLSPIYLTLLVAWVCAAAATLAVVGLLFGTLRLSERRAAFVSAVTHELRTPLTTLRLYSDMLERGMVKEDAQRGEYLRTLRIEADRLGQLVANVLSFARLERGKNGTHIVAASVEDMLSGMQDRLRQRAGEAGMKLTLHLPEEMRSLSARCDPAAVEQILFNLVDNACKYAAQANDPTIELMVQADQRQVMLTVRDHGPGVSAEVAGKLFTPFSKSSAEAANSAPGVGLGLALSRRLARQMKAVLILSENGPAGACFTLRLPRVG